MISMTKKASTVKKLILILFISLLISGGICGYVLYKMIFEPNLILKDKTTTFIYIPTNSAFNDVVNMLTKDNLIKNQTSFEWIAKRMKYAENIHPGKYLLHHKMNNKEIVSVLRSGEQVPEKVILNNIRTKKQLAEIVGKNLEANPDVLYAMLNDKYFLKQYGLTEENSMIIFIPNTYEFYWNTSAEQFFDRMMLEYKRFWNDNRKEKSKAINFTPEEVSIIASIIELETSKDDEKDIIAGVYINRLNKNWKLEADPTVIYAHQDFTIKRVLNKHTEIDSPYNTYLYTGMPPGPICLPSIASIDAVLNYTKHEYMFFCAKEDFSGYHNFAKNYVQHLVNARKYRKALKLKGI